MDPISYAYADKQAQRIKKINANPDSASGVVTVPKVIASGESVTIPVGRVAVLPNVQVDGILNVKGEVFIPSGATFGDLESQIALKADTSYVNNKYSGFKNYIINGGFDVWQRGISFSGSSEYTSDRWKAHIDGNVGTKNRSTNVPTGYKYALSLAMTGSAPFTQIGQHIEFVNFKGLRGKTATLSFWVKANNTNIPVMTYRIRYSTNLEDEPILFTGSTLVSGSKTVSTTWQKHTASFDVPTGTMSMSIEFVTGAVSNGDIFYITGVQLEEGSVATLFEYRPYGLELSLCHRYFYKFDNYDALYRINKAVGLTTIPFPASMRTAPTISSYRLEVDGVQQAVNSGASAIQTNNEGVLFIVGAYTNIVDVMYFTASADL